MSGLLDTGASDCFMTTKLAKRLGLKINNVFDGKVGLADKDLKSKIMGKARADLVLEIKNSCARMLNSHY